MDTDRQTVLDILSGNELIIKRFLFKDCASIFSKISQKVFSHRIEKDELINEFYLYLTENDWQKLRQFDYRCKLTTWVWKVATNFFVKKRAELIENISSEDLMLKQIGVDYNLFLAELEKDEDEDAVEKKAENLLNKLKNERYRFVIQKLILEDYEPQKLANEMGITVAHLYKIKQRALQQLKKIIKK